MEELMKDGKDPEFWPESMSPFYTLPTGARSCYNHVVMAGLQRQEEKQSLMSTEQFSGKSLA